MSTQTTSTKTKSKSKSNGAAAQTSDAGNVPTAPQSGELPTGSTTNETSMSTTPANGETTTNTGDGANASGENANGAANGTGEQAAPPPAPLTKEQKRALFDAWDAAVKAEANVEAEAAKLRAQADALAAKASQATSDAVREIYTKCGVKRYTYNNRNVTPVKRGERFFMRTEASDAEEV